MKIIRIFDENFNKIAQAIADGILKTLYAQDLNFNEIPDYVQNMPEPEAFNGTYQGEHRIPPCLQVRNTSWHERSLPDAESNGRQ